MQKELLKEPTGAYQKRFLELWEILHDSENGYFSPQGVPYHSIETLIVEAPDYGHVTTSETLSYYIWLEAMYGKFTGDFSGFKKAWDIAETYIIPTEKDQPNSSMSGYNASKPATYAPEWELPSLYPAKLDSGAAVGTDPIYNDLKSTYGSSVIYGMHWLLDADNWYGFGRRGDGKSAPSYINTFQRGREESTWETIPQPCWDDMRFGGKNGFLDLFTGDSNYAKQFKYTDAPDADSCENANWSWVIGCSHNHFGYQNPMAAWILSQDDEFKPRSQNGASDWSKSLERQLEFYQWLQSDEGGIAGGVSNSNKGRYESWPSGTATFYGMGYQEHPVYADPGSNRWFGFQAWSMQRVAEYYYKTKNLKAKALLDKWVKWIKTVVKLEADGTFAIPDNLDWSGQPNNWTGSYTGNPNLHVKVSTYGTDLGVSGSLANTLLYYSKASGDDEARVLAKELLDRMWNLYKGDKGLTIPEQRNDYSRFFDQEVYVPSGWTGTMPNGDEIKSGVKFIDIRSKYKDDPDFQKVENAYKRGTAPVLTYHRFWAQCDIAIANGVYSMLFEGGGEPVNNSAIDPTSAVFDKKAGSQKDIKVTLTLNGNTFIGIKEGDKYLTEGVEYTLTDDTVVLLKTYLAEKEVGKLKLTFDFSAGINPVLVLTVTDSSIPTGNIQVQMYNDSTNPQVSSIVPKFKLTNTGKTSITLTDLKLRYYYTIDEEKDQNFWCDWSTVGSSNVTGTFVKMPKSKPGADYYLEIGFTAGAGKLAEGQSIEVPVRFNKIDWSSYTQTGDYSFSKSGSSYADWTKITGYVSGSLKWGVEP